MATKTENTNKRIFYLDDLDDYKVHHDDPDVRGWGIFTSDNKKMGEVENLIVDKAEKRVRYLDVHLEDDFLTSDPLKTKSTGEAGKIHEHINEEGHRHMIIPIGLVSLDDDENKVHLKSHSSDKIQEIPRYNKDKGVSDQYEIEVRRVLLPAEYSPQAGNKEITEEDYYNNQYYKYRRGNAT